MSNISISSKYLPNTNSNHFKIHTYIYIYILKASICTLPKNYNNHFKKLLGENTIFVPIFSPHFHFDPYFFFYRF